MATSPQPMPAMISAPPPGPQGAPAPPTANGEEPAVVKLVGGIEELVGMLQAVYPPAAPMVAQIKDQIQQIQVQMAKTQSPAQSAAPPI